jgi:hypothetical protein
LVEPTGKELLKISTAYTSGQSNQIGIDTQISFPYDRFINANHEEHEKESIN